MKFFLSDFVYLGASFALKSNPKMISEDEVLVCGDLIFQDERLSVAVKTKRGSVPRIVGITSNGSDGVVAAENAYNVFGRLKEIHRGAIKRNIRGFREMVRKRNLFILLLIIEYIILIANSGMAVFAMLVRGEYIALIMLIVCVILMKVLYICRWRIVPYGTLRSVGYNVVEYKKE